MSKFKSGGSLSSRDPSTQTVAVKLPADLLAALESTCEQQGLTKSEILRGLVSQWVYGKSQLSGVDEGYAQARSMATQLAHVALSRALTALPDSHGAAATMLQGHFEEQAERRRKS